MIETPPGYPMKGLQCDIIEDKSILADSPCNCSVLYPQFEHFDIVYLEMDQAFSIRFHI